jgi:hypothetical protein
MELTEVSGNLNEDAGATWAHPGDDGVPMEQAPLAVEPARPTAVCVYTGPVCVAIVDWAPPPPPNGGVCHCGACHGNYHADSAAWFY